MNSTSSPQSLLSLFSTLPPSQMQPEIEEFPLDDSNGFSSILETLLPPSLGQVSSASKLQSLPLAAQALPLSELGSQELIPTETENQHAMDSVLSQLNFGPIGIINTPLKTVVSSDALVEANTDVENSATTLADSERLEREESLLNQDIALPPPLAEVMQQVTNADLPQRLDVRVGNRSLEQADARIANLNTNANANAPALSADDSELSVSSTILADISSELDDSQLSKSESAFYMPSQETLSDNDADIAFTMNRTAIMDNASLSQPVVSSMSVLQAQVATNNNDAPSLLSGALVEVSELKSESLQTQLLREKLEFGENRSEWGGALGARIMTMISNDIQEARIQLDPPELGSLEIKLKIQNEQATIQVQVQNPQVRDVLESHAQRLRDSLAGQGISLSEFDVSERGQQQEQQQGQQPGASGDSANWLASDEGHDQDAMVKSSMNLLDTFA